MAAPRQRHGFRGFEVGTEQAGSSRHLGSDEEPQGFDSSSPWPSPVPAPALMCDLNRALSLCLWTEAIKTHEKVPWGV